MTEKGMNTTTPIPAFLSSRTKCFLRPRPATRAMSLVAGSSFVEQLYQSGRQTIDVIPFQMESCECSSCLPSALFGSFKTELPVCPNGRVVEIMIGRHRGLPATLAGQ